MIVRITPRAERDIAEIIGYVEAFSPQGARNVALRLQQTFRILGEQPRTGAPTQRNDVFVKIVPGYPYKVFYRLSSGAVEILHIRHSSRRPWIP